MSRRIAVDSGPLESGHKFRGIGTYVRGLQEGIRKNKTDIRVDFVNFASEDLSKYDLIHYPYFNPFSRLIPLDTKHKTVVTIHDLIQLVYPKHFQSGFRGKLNFFHQKRVVKNISGVITDSEASKEDIVRFYNIDPKKIRAIHLAARDMFRVLPKSHKSLKESKNKYKLPDKFVLYVGDVNYNKNVVGLAKACRLVDIPLVICGKQAADINDNFDFTTLKGPRDLIRLLQGKPHPEIAHYRELSSQFKQGGVMRLGYVSDEELIAIYNMAGVYCQPSFYEGFGLNVFEAMKCGIPCVIARTNCLVEISGGASLIVDPKNPEDIASSIDKFLNNSKLRNEYIKKGKELVERYSWEKTGKLTLDYYKEVMNY